MKTIDVIDYLEKNIIELEAIGQQNNADPLVQRAMSRLVVNIGEASK